MGIRDSFCPRCGRPSVGLCESCRLGGVSWVRIEPRVLCTFCPTCGAVRDRGSWTLVSAEREQLVEALVLSALTLHPEVRALQYSVDCEDWSSNRTACTIGVKGELQGQPVEALLETEVVWKAEQCTRCSRQSGGYYEGVVQVRASGRPMSEREKDLTVRLASEVERSFKEGGDSLAFVSRIDEVHQGIDVVVGTQSLGRAIAQAVLDRLGGAFSTHPKLMGEKDGAPLYRITYALRLPRHRRGDVVEIRGRYHEVRESDGKRVTLYDLSRGEIRVHRPEPDWRLVGNVEQALTALVAYRDGETLGLIDPRSGVTREVRVLPWLEIRPADRVRVVPDDDRDTLVIVG